MFAGIVSLNKSRKINSQLIVEIKKNFCRKEGLKAKEIEMNNAFFIRSSTKALTDYPGVFTEGLNLVSLMAGEPLMTKKGVRKDHRSIVNAISHEKYDILKTARGVFCVAQYQEKDEVILQLCADKLGVRPIYYWTDGFFVVFSTVIRIFENISIVPDFYDQKALSEIIAFGFALGNRTKYQHVKLLREAEVKKFTIGKTNSTTYWRWDKIEQTKVPKEEVTLAAYEIFQEAISIRLQKDTDAFAFLSGGMDSRAIVSALLERDINIHSFNFSPKNSQDQDFAIRYAEESKCHLSLLPRDIVSPLGFRCQLARLVSNLVQEKITNATRPKVIWSGDGGSVSLGCVYLNKKIVEMMRSNNILDAIQTYRDINSCALPLRAMKPKKQVELSRFLDTVILEEIKRLDCADPGQAFFIFLMINDQRRHLHDFYEDIDMHQLEYQLPFFDSVLLEFIFKLPLDYRLNHQFYSDWFKEFSPSIRTTPWQTYPGHVPCPIPIDKNLEYQWSKKKIKFGERLIKNYSFGMSGSKIAFFSSSIGPLSRSKLFLVSLAHLLGIRDYSYVIKAGEIYSGLDPEDVDFI